MPSKYELAAYLVNLHTIMEAQAATVSLKSKSLAAEYEAGYEELKSILESDNEAGNRREQSKRAKARADQPQRQREGSESDRNDDSGG